MGGCDWHSFALILTDEDEAVNEFFHYAIDVIHVLNLGAGNVEYDDWFPVITAKDVCGFSCVGAVGNVVAGEIARQLSLANFTSRFVVPVNVTLVGDGVDDIEEL